MTTNEEKDTSYYNDERYPAGSHESRTLFSLVLYQLLEDAFLSESKCLGATVTASHNRINRTQARAYFFNNDAEFKEDREIILSDYLGVQNVDDCVQKIRDLINSDKSWKQVKKEFKFIKEKKE
jgi:hypothetical protein